MPSYQELKNWAIFEELEENFLIKIKLAWIPDQNEAFVVTTDDDVFAIGSNINGCHGVGNSTPSPKPQKVEALCKKKVIDFASNEDFVEAPILLARTANGDVFVWGKSLKKGQLLSSVPAMIRKSFRGKVVSIACGGYFGMALTDKGFIYLIGRDKVTEISISSGTNMINFLRKYPLSSAVQVACGLSFTIIVLNCGQIFSWGRNRKGQLGLGHRQNETNEPCHVTALEEHFITKVACGRYYALALTSRGHLFAWGENCDGQLGIGSLEDADAPQKIGTRIGVVSDIAVSLTANTSLAVSDLTQICYVWGICQSNRLWEPLEIPIGDMHYIFNFYLDCYPYTFEVSSQPASLRDTYRAAFDSNENTDVTFVVEGQELHAHKSVLMIRSEYFKAFLKESWVEPGKPIEIKQYSYEIFKSYLRYIYNNDVDLEKTGELVELMDLAKSNLDSELLRKCESLLTERIKVRNAAALYTMGVKYNAKKLEELSFLFCIDNITEVIKTDAFSKMDKDACLAMISKAGEKGLFKSIGAK